MAKGVTFKWVTPPGNLSREIKRYGQKALVAVHAVGVQSGVKMQNEARQNAPWQDRTGNARGGLFFAVDGLGQEPRQGETRTGQRPGAKALFTLHEASADGVGGDATTLVIVLGHTMDYGKHLELSHGGRYAIIVPTIEANLPELQRMLNDLFKG